VGGFSLKRYIRAGERVVIERALRDAGGSVSRASRLLGFRHHQSLISLLNTRHKDLLEARSKVRKRRRNLTSPKKRNRETPKPKSLGLGISVLHVEDDKAVAKRVEETLSAAGMDVELCSSGRSALEVLSGTTAYDVMIVDNDLPGTGGLELVVRVRTMDHRRNMKIIMLSDDQIEREAWRAGVHDFMKKPEDIQRLPSKIIRLRQDT